MFLRLVQFRVNADSLWRFRQFFNQAVVPALESAGGCLYAALMQSDVRGEDVISLTLWDEEASASRYEQSGIYQALLEQSSHYLADPADYRLELSRDLKLEYRPVPFAPVVRRFTGSFASDASLFLATHAASMYFRFVSIKIQEGSTGEFVALYEREVAPALMALPGCRLALLTRSTADPSDYVSLTVWLSAEDAGEYERSGAFGRLTEKIKHTFSGLYQWKLGVERKPGAQAATSDDLAVRTYNLLADKILRPGATGTASR